MTENYSLNHSFPWYTSWNCPKFVSYRQLQ